MAAGLAIALSTAQQAAQSQSIQSVSTRELRSTTAAKIATANVVEQPPAIDGNVLDDPAWADAVAVSGFRQSTPNAGEAATERTEVRVVFTDDAVYFGVVCYDRDPSSIIVSDSRRDSSMNDADSFQMVLDTFHDQQNGFVFGTTPAGQEYDGQVVNEGEGRGGFRGSGGGDSGTGRATARPPRRRPRLPRLAARSDGPSPAAGRS